MTKLRAADVSAAAQFAKAFETLKAQVDELNKRVIDGDNQR